MSTTHETNIDSILTEKRTFEPSPEFRSQAHIKSMEEYERMYKRLNPDVEVEVLNWRVIVSGPRPTIRLAPATGRQAPVAAARKRDRPAYFPETSGYLSCPVYDRYRLAAGMILHGPVIIEERESTIVVGPGAYVEVDISQNVVIGLPTSSVKADTV